MQIPGAQSATRFPWLALIFAAMALAGCDKPAPQKRAATPPPPPPPPPLLPIVSVDEVPAPGQPTMKLDAGMTLGHIAELSYGHERFSGLIARHNEIADVNRIPAGKELKTPALSVIFQTAGLDSHYQPLINVIAKAAMDFKKALPAYIEARNHATGGTNGQFTVPAEIKTTLTECADGISAACHQLGKVEAGHKVPKKTVEQFRQAESYLRALANGAVDENGYDSNLVGQRLGLGLTNAFFWMTSGYQ